MGGGGRDYERLQIRNGENNEEKLKRRGVMCMDTEEEKGEHKGSKTLFNYNYLLYFPSLILFFPSQIAMKTQDHQLAMQLMKLRGEIQALKLQKTSDDHRELIEDARYSMVEESVELKSALFDLPMNNNFYPIGEDPLKDIGVTRMNLNSRRFSLR